MEQQDFKYKVNKKKKLLSSGMAIATLIVLSPLLFYSYQAFPSGKTWSFFGITINSNFYQDINVLAWVILGKIVPLLLLLIWFFTCKHWWYHVILVPISMYIIQIFNGINEDLLWVDSREVLIIIPIIALFFTVSYAIRNKIFDKIYGIDLDQEFKRVRWNGKIVKIPIDSELNLPEIDSINKNKKTKQ